MICREDPCSDPDIQTGDNIRGRVTYLVDQVECDQERRQPYQMFIRIQSV